MMALLSNHLEQIKLSAKSIGELEFAASKPFTNALLHNREITALIRDTEPHERGLFSINQPVKTGQSARRNYGNDAETRRKTLNNGAQTQPSAVARVLGNDMLKKIQSSNRDGNRGRGIDLEVLLQGVEKLCAAYEVPGAIDRVSVVRERHHQISASIQRFEDKVSKQQTSMTRFNIGREDQNELAGLDDTALNFVDVQSFSEQNLIIEEEAVRDLEQKKKALEGRLAEMDRDLGGLLR